MNWLIARQKDAHLVEQALYASGKALYVANRFELKCQHVLPALKLADAVRLAAAFPARDADDDPVEAVKRFFAERPDHKPPGDTLEDLEPGPLLGMSKDEAAVLAAARQARGEIAHHGADIGSLDCFDHPRMIEFLRRLRGWVADVAAGDAIVTCWLHTIEEKEPLPSHMSDRLGGAVDRFVFGHIPPEWLNDEADAGANLGLP
jgi:hypothetical protein